MPINASTVVGGSDQRPSSRPTPGIFMGVSWGGRAGIAVCHCLMTVSVTLDDYIELVAHLPPTVTGIPLLPSHYRYYVKSPTARGTFCVRKVPEVAQIGRADTPY